jgi:diguanylate cyclase (GGDEF)-like protein
MNPKDSVLTNVPNFQQSLLIDLTHSPLDLVNIFESLLLESVAWYWQQDEELRFTRFVGKKIDEMHLAELCLGKTRWEIDRLIPGQDIDWSQHKVVLEEHRAFSNVEISLLQTDESLWWYSVSGMPLLDIQGRFVGYHGIGIDINSKKLAEAKASSIEHFDILTGANSRRLFVDRLKNALDLSQRTANRYLLFDIDIDNFKSINELHGFAAGDDLLKAVSQRLFFYFGFDATVCRFAGNEYTVITLLSSAANGEDEDPSDEIKRLHNVLSIPYRCGDKELFCTFSVGVIIFDKNQKTADEVLNCVQMAMYEVKASGKNNWKLFQNCSLNSNSQVNQIERDLGSSIDRNQLAVFYQPLCNESRAVVGYEALVRWNHPLRGILSPNIFIPIAERNGLIVQIGEWVLRKACERLAQWSLHPSTDFLSISVNLSARQINSPDLFQSVERIVRDSNAVANRLKLEITESMLLIDSEETILKLKRIHDLGIRISLDDFGTGYSSLSYLKRLPLSQLKIDKTFVDDLLTDPNDKAISAAIIGLAKSLNLEVIAEGVESQEQFDELLDMGCRRFQGYFFGHPQELSI